MNRALLLLILLSCGLLSGCDFLFGSKKDSTVDEILEQGAIDPSLIPTSVGYVPVLPIWDQFSNPTDVWVGYDEMIYVTDDSGLNILDLKGTLQRTISIPEAKKVTQDRMLRTYVVGRVSQNINGTDYNLAAVYVISNTATASGPIFLDTLIHPFNDKSRNNTNFRGSIDEEVEFAGIAAMSDNSLYLARRGPLNSLTAISQPDNSVLIYDKNLNYTGFANGLDPILSNLKSVLEPSCISTFLAPPQLVFGMNNSRDFLIGQQSENAEYKLLWIRQSVNPDTGPEYNENITLLDFDTTRAEQFLYGSFRFSKPSDVCIAPDGTAYIFVVDSERDSVYQFTSNGYEGVNPPANTGIKKQIVASFGGTGNGPFQFDGASGVAYFQRTLYVADKGNNRVMRYRLSTDLE